MSENVVDVQKTVVNYNAYDSRGEPQAPPQETQKQEEPITWQMKYFPTFCKLFGRKK